MAFATIPHHKTAMRPGDLSRPMKCAVHDGLIGPAVSVFDYGCGHGQDSALLNSAPPASHCGDTGSSA